VYEIPIIQKKTTTYGSHKPAMKVIPNIRVKPIIKKQ
jgi:hypothetical protein